MRYFSGNIFVILNMLGTAIQDLRTIIRPDTHDFMRDEANSHLDKIQTMFDEINQLLNLFPKA